MQYAREQFEKECFIVTRIKTNPNPRCYQKATACPVFDDLVSILSVYNDGNLKMDLGQIVMNGK